MRMRGRGGPKEGRHVRLYHYVMKTAAWKSLDVVARCVYIEIASRYAGAGSNNGRIPCSVRELAEALNLGSKNTANRALRDLQERGFIVPVKIGAFSLKKRHATEWRLTEYVSDVDNHVATKEFATWELKKSPEIQNPVLLEGPTVPSIGPYGSLEGTAKLGNASYGSLKGTVQSEKNPLRFTERDTSKLPVGCNSTANYEITDDSRARAQFGGVLRSTGRPFQLSDDRRASLAYEGKPFLITTDGELLPRQLDVEKRRGRPQSELSAEVLKLVALSGEISIAMMSRTLSIPAAELAPMLAYMVRTGKLVRPKRAHYARAA
jgi:DNA-binding transcriptional regulator YhcF (GntR family)